MKTNVLSRVIAGKSKVAEPINLDHLSNLMYHLGAEKVARLLRVDNVDILRAWLGESCAKVPTEDQIAQVTALHNHFFPPLTVEYTSQAMYVR